MLRDHSVHALKDVANELIYNTQNLSNRTSVVGRPTKAELPENRGGNRPPNIVLGDKAV
jgi:hypothetical protein